MISTRGIDPLTELEAARFRARSSDMTETITFGAEHLAVEDSATRRLARSVVPARYRPAVAGTVRAALHRGDAVRCPCCNGTFDAFVRHRGRPHAKCPRCGALERHRMLWRYLVERTDLLATGSLLHFAPEYAFARRLARIPSLRYVTADLDSPLAMDRVDIMDLPYADATFGAVLCSHVLEHVEDDRRALREIRRVLRPGGWAILMTPIDARCDATLEDPSVTTPEDRHRVFGQSDHVRLYGRDFADRVRAEGFAVRDDAYLEQIDPRLIARQGMRRDDDEAFGDEHVFMCSRPSPS
jgi:SAM-dependent methyltransferase